VAGRGRLVLNDGDLLTGEIPSYVIPVFEDADRPRCIHPSNHRLWFGSWCFGDLHLPINHLDSRWVGEFEPSDRCDVTDALEVPVVVVIRHPRIQSSLSLGDGGENLGGEELNVLCCRSTFPVVVGDTGR
jgi:hypothetical protein